MPAEWFVYLAVRKSCATARPVGELVEFMRTWHGSNGAVSARRVHDLQLHDGRITADRIWCVTCFPRPNSRSWPQPRTAGMAPSEVRRRKVARSAAELIGTAVTELRS